MLVFFTAALCRVGVWYFFCGFDLCLVINSVGFSFLLLLLYACGCVIVDLCS